ncbi:hypothetical protein ACOCEA_17945 [Maribacter sp. CXY002]|uniref:hypothetical protein n=1 Tax=Maribacter luteocoastalis TaxID=3407671 RepID=UPI003B66D86F
MKTLENKILRFDNWSQPWTFKESIEQTLNESELTLFREIWLKAGNFELWNHSDLILGCKASQKFLEDNYSLSDKAIANVVRGLSYEWK